MVNTRLGMKKANIANEEKEKSSVPISRVDEEVILSSDGRSEEQGESDRRTPVPIRNDEEVISSSKIVEEEKEQSSVPIRNAEEVISSSDGRSEEEGESDRRTPVPIRNDEEVISSSKIAEEEKEQSSVPIRNAEEVISSSDGRSEEEGESDRRTPVPIDERERFPAPSVRNDEEVAEVEEEEKQSPRLSPVTEELREESEEHMNEVSEDESEEEADRSLSSSRTVSDSMEEIDPPLEPLRMYFPPSEYNKKIKLGTRCFIYEALNLLDGLTHPLTTVERKWFEEHPQFQHIFHMPRDKNHKVMGMWMLFLRNACTEKKKEAWFVVNGVPIRYGIKEHALISGFNCCNYPLDYKKAGSEAFVKKHFKGQKTIRYQDVRDKLEKMVPVGRSLDRLKMAVLYFLSSIVIAHTKMGKDATPVESFFLRAVDDLQFCRDFPWGRLSFDNMLKEIEHTMAHFGGTVKEGVLWPVPGFCIPMELLAFEAIPELGEKFLEDHPEADEHCPRMCKKRFKKGECKGIPLSKIYKTLGTTVDIDSILIVRDEEKDLLATITEEEDDEDEHDVVVESWMRCQRKGFTISLDNMYSQDVATRVEEAPQETRVDEEIGTNERSVPNESPGHPTFEEFAKLIDIVNEMKGEMMSKLVGIEEKLVVVDNRLGLLEASHIELMEKSKAHSGSAEPAHEDTAGSINPPEAAKKQAKKGVKRAGVGGAQNQRMTRSRTSVL